MKLYYHPASTTSRPITLFAADNNIPLDYQLVDLFTGEHAQPTYAAINPNQTVPLLEDGDFRLTESSAILKYLADKIDSPAYPTEPRQRARINERMDWFNTCLSRELGYGFIYPQVLPNHKRQDDHAQQQTLAWGKANAQRWLTVLDQHWLGANRYVCGDQISIADYLGIAHVTLGEVIKLNYSRWPNVSRWVARMQDRASWPKVNADFYTHFVQPYANGSFVAL
jgi:glutathione S-transferase